ncbi:hypothetical protein [Rhizobium sp. BK060]|uniref:hypothetical protein n=1 Tax=Rhizobium sp. BK060 TaxID=2587096 RepID=UPI001616E55A|nr:hypothetical protein [Rhizobium sp. BK060]MBB3394498.1 hypothetical protein [Rhizobium sp. BK060]
MAISERRNGQHDIGGLPGTKIKLGGKSEPLIFDVPQDTAILVEGVHVYIQMLDFGNAMIERERETEASHRRVLSMLHLNYAACDQVAEEERNLNRGRPHTS